jgi:hypothetical protein
MAISSSQSSEISLPCRVVVQRVVSSRYDSKGAEASNARPDSWDDRIEGIDVVETGGAGVVRLLSSPMQSTPKPGWVLLLGGGNAGSGYSWTLYGITPLQ